MNEEETKIQVVWTVLEKLGIRREEVSYEKNFSFRAGRHTIRVDTEEQIKTIQSRLDILFSRDGKNLFVIEVKAPRYVLNEEDRDQAISYARLVHPIAPYAITTNGVDTHIYETISKNEVKAEALNLVAGYEVTLPDELRYEAQKVLLGYSVKNLHLFCHEQSKANLRPLVGSKEDRSKKYIPELHIPRQDLLQRVKDFLATQFPFFVVLGASGVGKTSTLCHLTQYLLDQDEAVFFYRGIMLKGDIEEEISREFEWGFPISSSSLVAVLDRLESILKGRRLVLVVDAIDEWAYASKVQSLVNLAKHVSRKPLKVILSCKFNSWQQFLVQRGTKTGILDYVFSIRDQPAVSSEASPKDRPGYLLPLWSEQEFVEVVERSRDFYSFRGHFEEKVLREARHDPFLLRVLFEVAENSHLEHLLSSSRELFEAYHCQITAKTEDEGLARKQLRAVAEALFSANADSFDGDELEQKIGIGPDKSLMRELFEYDILEKVETKGNVRVRFSFQGLRDYITVFHVLKWHEASIEKFTEDIRALRQDG
ncbi:MAG: type I restriction enzyme HsdR N-terminal domain-containing protein, partial [Candidatus Binatia bacterium]